MLYCPAGFGYPAGCKRIERMKAIKNITFTILLCVNYSIGANAQSSYYIDTEDRYNCDASADTVLVFAEKMPEFPGGRSALMEFFAENIIHPAEIIYTGWQGRIFLQFVVRKTGEVTDISAFHEVFPPLDKEAVRVAKLMPDWIPGEHNGEKVNVKFILPLNLHLEPYERQAQFPGGVAALNHFLRTNIRYPDEAQRRGVEGRVVLQFTIGIDGRIDNIQIVESVVLPFRFYTMTNRDGMEVIDRDRILRTMEREALRVVRAMPLWIPAEQEGRLVRSRFTLPVVFRLQ